MGRGNGTCFGLQKAGRAVGLQRSRNREKWKRSPVEHVVGYSVQDRRVDPPLRLGPGASVLWAAGYTNMTKLGKLWVLNGAEIRKSENAALSRTWWYILCSIAVLINSCVWVLELRFWGLLGHEILA